MRPWVRLLRLRLPCETDWQRSTVRYDDPPARRVIGCTRNVVAFKPSGRGPKKSRGGKSARRRESDAARRERNDTPRAQASRRRGLGTGASALRPRSPGGPGRSPQDDRCRRDRRRHGRMPLVALGLHRLFGSPSDFGRNCAGRERLAVGSRSFRLRISLGREGAWSRRAIRPRCRIACNPISRFWNRPRAWPGA